MGKVYNFVKSIGGSVSLVNEINKILKETNNIEEKIDDKSYTLLFRDSEGKILKKLILEPTESHKLQDYQDAFYKMIY